MSLSDVEITRIARDTTEAIVGASRIVSLDVSAGPDWSGTSSYFIDVTLDQDRDREAALSSRLKLRSAIRDRLVNAGDETYPYVRILNRVAASAGG